MDDERFTKYILSLDGFYPALEAGEIKAGTVLIFRYQGPKGAPGMPEMLGESIHISPRLPMKLTQTPQVQQEPLQALDLLVPQP